MNTINVESSVNNPISSLLSLCDISATVLDLSTGNSWKYINAEWVLIEDLKLGITSTRAFRGDHGSTAYNHSIVVDENPHGTVASQVPSTYIAKPVGSIGTTEILGDTYSTVIMPDGKEWLSENLKYTGFGVWWNNAVSDDGDGRYYNYQNLLAIQALLSDGWAFPVDSDMSGKFSIWNSTTGKLVSVQDSGTDTYGLNLKLGGYAEYGQWYGKNNVARFPYGDLSIASQVAINSTTTHYVDTNTMLYNIRLVKDPLPSNVQADLDALYRDKLDIADIDPIDLDPLYARLSVIDNNIYDMYTELENNGNRITVLENLRRSTILTLDSLSGNDVIEYYATDLTMPNISSVFEIRGYFSSTITPLPLLYMRDVGNDVPLTFTADTSSLPYAIVNSRTYVITIKKLGNYELMVTINEKSYYVSALNQLLSSTFSFGFKCSVEGVVVRRIDWIP